MKSIKVCEYSRSRSFHYDLILQDQDSGERSQDQWSSGFTLRQTASLSSEGAVSASCSLENVTQEHDCVCRNTLPGNAANSTTWPNQSTVISVNFVDHLCMLIPCNITGERASI